MPGYIKKYFIFILTVALIGIALSVKADESGYRTRYDYGEPAFEIETVDFSTDSSGFNTLEIYYKLFYHGLSFQKVDSGYMAAYEVTVSITGEDNLPLMGDSRRDKIVVPRYADTRRRTDFVINKFSADMTPQKVEIRAVVIDENTEESRELTRKYELTDFVQKYPTMSPVEFIRDYHEANQKSKFNRGEFWMIPSVARVFGYDVDSLLLIYQEVYLGDKTPKYLSLITKMVHMGGDHVYSDTIKLGELDSTWKGVRAIDISNVMPADYDLEISLEGRRGRTFDKRTEPFEIALTAERIFKTDYELAVKMLKYLATSDEMKKLKKAKTTEEQRQAWNEFWIIRDNDIHDEENPTRVEYFRRVRHANRYFSYMGRDGWKTGRGMVYITYGEPDEIEDHPFELASKPYQIWHYYRINPPREFIFIDEWGDGNFELQPPYNGIN